MCKPLTKEQRDSIANNLGEPWWPGSMRGARMALTRMEHWLRQYEATVEDLEMRLALAEEDADFCNIKRNEAESQLAELQRLAEVGRAVAGMAVGDELRRGNERAWTLTRHNDVHRRGFTALAALRAAKGATDG